MSLDAQHRSSIYQKLVPILGEDDANVLVSEFPTHDGDDLVTKDFLRAELAELRVQMTRQALGLAGLVVASAGALGIWG